MRFIISYDIVNNRRRGKIAKVLEGNGERVQDSVFEVEMSEQELTFLLRRLCMLINVNEDSLRVYPLCRNCAGKVIRTGINPDDPLQPRGAVVI